MTDAEYAATRKRVGACFDHWMFRMGMKTDWQVHITYVRGERVPENESVGHWQTLMDVAVQWEYQKADIRVFCVAVADASDDDLSRTVRHELLHVLVNEMRMYRFFDERTDHERPYRMHEERVVCQLQRAFAYATDPEVNLAQYPWPLAAEDGGE